MTPCFDVAIVGSGPAGASCALRLARNGANVALVDAKPFPRNKLCGEYLNLGAIRELYDVGVGDELSSRATPLKGMRLFIHNDVATFPISPSAWSMARTLLDDCIRNAALRAGTEPIPGRVRRIDIRDDRVLLAIERNGEEQHVAARFVVGADGMQSNVARLCRLTRAVHSEAFAIGAHHADIELGDWIEMYACEGGYVAFNPLDSRSANVVFVIGRKRLADAAGDLRDELTQFCRRATNGTHTLNDPHYHEKRRAIGPLAHRTVRPVAHRVLLAGDAAAFVDPFTGQGVYLALTGGRLASRALTAALRNQARQRDAFREYAHDLRAAVAERELVTLMMKTFLRCSVVARRASRRLRLSPQDFSYLIDAVCAKRTANPLQLAAAVAQALR